MKNNTPACILLSPENYQRLIEQLDDNVLLVEAEKRAKINTENTCITHSDLLAELNISEKELKDAKVEID